MLNRDQWLSIYTFSTVVSLDTHDYDELSACACCAALWYCFSHCGRPGPVLLDDYVTWKRAGPPARAGGATPPTKGVESFL